MYSRNHSPSDSKVNRKIEDLGPEVETTFFSELDEARLDAMIWALDRILPRVTSEPVFREECPCRWCYRLRDREAVAQ